MQDAVSVRIRSLKFYLGSLKKNAEFQANLAKYRDTRLRSEGRAAAYETVISHLEIILEDMENDHGNQK